jgi:predicted Rossmann fold flavoprotein
VFAAAAAASKLDQATTTGLTPTITVLEATPKTLTKVSISGGGRCNVLHDTMKPVPQLLSHYPRGNRELNGLFQKHFTPSQMKEWFKRRGVELHTEADGRMFPVTNDSATIVNCLLEDAERGGVCIRTKEKVVSLSKVGDGESDDGVGFVIETSSGSQDIYDAVILATGSSRMGWDMAQSFGHSIVPPVPSLFTLNAKHQIKEGQVFCNLAGVSVPHAKTTLRIKVEGKKKKKVLEQEGPLLVTHHGLTGPAVLRLSAFAAREFHDLNYRTDVIVHWAPEFGNAMDIETQLWKMKGVTPKRNVASSCPLINNPNDDDNTSPVIPRRLWSALARESGFEKDDIWAEVSKKKVGTLSRMIAEFNVDVTGKGVFKEEFVTAGGVKLKEITMKTMESKKCEGLYFCGEVIDVDGVTGGFNFMNCWSTGHTAGVNAVEKVLLSMSENQNNEELV